MAAKRKKRYWEMTADELAEATKEFDREIPAHKLRPLTPAQCELWNRAKRLPSRSIFITRGDSPDTTTLLIRLKSDLVRRLDEYAKSRKITREQLMEKSVRTLLSFVEEDQPVKKKRRSA
jgi:hypothetical protein